MTPERTIAQLFRMDDATWLRHANPWSGILRNTALPLLIIAFWSAALARVVGSHPGCYYTPVDLVQPQNLPGTAIARSLDVKGGTGRASMS